MNRRTFLLAVGASACGPTKQPRPPKQTPLGAGSGSARSTEPGGLIDTQLLASQWRASAIALRGDMLVQAAGGELRIYDARTLKRTETRDLAPRHFCFGRDGSLFVYSYPSGALQGTLYRIGPSRNLETYGGPVLRPDGYSVLLPGRTAQDVYVTEMENIVPLSIVDGHVEDGPPLRHPAPNAQNRDQLVARPDGSIVAPDREDGLRVITPDGKGTSYPMKGREPRHIVGASGDRVWYSHAPGKHFEVTSLYLAKIATPLEAEHTIDVSPYRIIHLAAGGGAAAALAVHVRPTGDRGPEDLDIRWAVIVIGEDGAERWRAEIPAAFAPGMALITGFVAIDDKHVVLERHDHSLLGWDAATGKPIA